MEHKANFDGRHTRKWTVEDHCSWVNSKNFGVSHFGLHPTLLRLDEVRIGTLHCSCSIGRKLLDYLRVFITKFSDSFQESFITALEKNSNCSTLRYSSSTNRSVDLTEKSISFY